MQDKVSAEKKVHQELVIRINNELMIQIIKKIFLLNKIITKALQIR